MLYLILLYIRDFRVKWFYRNEKEINYYSEYAIIRYPATC